MKASFRSIKLKQ